MIHVRRSVVHLCVIWATGELIKSANTNEEYCMCVFVKRRGRVRGEMLSKQGERLTAQHIVPGNEGKFGNMKCISKDRQVRAAASCCQSYISAAPTGMGACTYCSHTHPFNQLPHAQQFSDYVGSSHSCTHIQPQKMCDGASAHTHSRSLNTLQTFYMHFVLLQAVSPPFTSVIVFKRRPYKSCLLKADSASSCRCDTWFINSQNKPHCFH